MKTKITNRYLKIGYLTLRAAALGSLAFLMATDSEKAVEYFVLVLGLVMIDQQIFDHE